MLGRRSLNLELTTFDPEIERTARENLSDVVFCLPKYINNKITTRNSTNPYRIGLC
jgi:hypothetical protein